MAYQEVIADIISKRDISSVLEVGCGDGQVLKLIKGPSVEGCDIEGEGVKACDIRKTLPYPDNSFDLVFTAATLIYVEPMDIKDASSEMLRVARKEVAVMELQCDKLSARGNDLGHAQITEIIRYPEGIIETIEVEKLEQFSKTTYVRDYVKVFGREPETRRPIKDWPGFFYGVHCGEFMLFKV